MAWFCRFSSLQLGPLVKVRWYGLASPSDEGRWSITFSWSEVNGRSEPVGVALDHKTNSSALTAEVLRRVPWGTLIRDTRAQLRKGSHAGDVWPSAVLGTRAGLAERFAPARGKAQTDEAHEAVATVYRRAWQSGERPTKAVADAFSISYSTASKRVAAARRAGYLPPAAPGKARG